MEVLRSNLKKGEVCDKGGGGAWRGRCGPRVLWLKMTGIRRSRDWGERLGLGKRGCMGIL